MGRSVTWSLVTYFLDYKNKVDVEIHTYFFFSKSKDQRRVCVKLVILYVLRDLRI